MNDISLREEIVNLEKIMTDMSDGTEMDNFPVSHYFAPGAYAREMFIPKDSTIIGKIHKHAHLNILSFGKVTVATEEGTIVIEAPHTFTSLPGTKRAVYAIEDTLWTTIHVTDETDLEKIEEEVIAPSFEALEVFKQERIGEKL